MAQYMFSPRWKRRRAPVVRSCEYDKRPCEFCPRGCIYARKLRLLENKVHGPLSLNMRISLFEAVRAQQMAKRP